MSTCQKCLICYSSAKRLNESNKGNKINCEISAFFLTRKLFEISNITCTNLLKDHGNPSSWFVCCSKCFTAVRNAQAVFKQLMKIESKWKNLKSTLELQLLNSYNHQKHNTDSNDAKAEVIIREEICKRLENGTQEIKTTTKVPIQKKINSEEFDDIKIELKEENQEYEDQIDESTLFHMDGDNLSEISYTNNEEDPLKFGNADSMLKGDVDDVGFNSRIQNVGTTTKNCSISLTKLKDKYKGIRSKTLPKRQRIRKKATNGIKNIRPNNNGEFPCLLCGRSFELKASLLRHRQKIHFPNDPEEKSPPTFQYPVEVDLLTQNENPTSDGTVGVHDNITPNVRLYSCSLCGKTFELKTSLKRHRQRIHFPNDPEEKSPAKFKDPVNAETSFPENGNKTTSGMVDSYENTTPSDSVYPCKLCGKSYKVKSNLIRHHWKVHSPNDPKAKSSPKVKYSVKVDKSVPEFENAILASSCRCRRCEKHFSIIIQRYEHENAVHGMKNQFVCMKCKSCFTNEAGLILHFNQLHGEKDNNGVFSCWLCGRSYEVKSSLLRHRQKIHFPNDPEEKSPPTFQYPVEVDLLTENENPTSDETVGIHENITPNVHLYSCSLCDKSFESKTSLKRHRQRIHFPNDPEEKSSPKVKYSVEVDKSVPEFQNAKLASSCRCRRCEKHFVSIIQRYEHENAVHGMKNQFVCMKCKSCFTNEVDLILHFNQLHGKNDDDKNQKTMICEHCGKVFICSNTFRTHVEVVHKKIRKFVCETCSESFTQLRYLKFHQVREHNMVFDNMNMNELTCEQCGKIMRSTNALRLHIKGVHEKKYKFYCSVCNVGRFNQSAMNQHMRTHGNEKPDKCSLCDKSYSCKQTLVEHMRTHSNETLSCKHCDRSFFTKHSLSRHEELHDGQIYKCEFCDKTFLTKHYIRNHRRYAHNVQIRKSAAKELKNSIEPNQDA